MRRKKLISMLVLAVILILTGCKAEKEQMHLEPVEIENQEQTDEQPVEEAEEHIVVYVCGAVKEVGVYKLPAGSRVYEAIQMAGGFSKKAAVSQMNQAEILEDEAYLYVPTVDEVDSVDGAYSNGSEKGKVNLNKATKEELMTLSGVGEAKADQIIQYREEYGKFRKIEDIMNISGIKEGLFNKIKDDITV